MLRLHLGPADLRRLRFATALHPIGTALLAFQALRDSASSGVAPALAGAGTGSATALLRHLVPTKGLLPDFLTPYDGIESVAAGIEAIRATPRHRISVDVTAAYAHTRTSPLRRRFAAADPGVLDPLLVALRRYFDAVLGPHWAELTLHHRRDVAQAAHCYALTGVDGLLAGLHPAIRWRPPTLEIDTWWSADLSGTGQGVLLQPTPLAGFRPRVLVEPDRPAIIVYPVPTSGSVSPDPTSGSVSPDPVSGSAGAVPDPLARLLGRTRAAVLRRLGEPGRHTTTTLGRDTEVSVSSASEHATALRAAGLVVSLRDGGAVVHQLTALGLDLLGRGQRDGEATEGGRAEAPGHRQARRRSAVAAADRRGVPAG